MSNRNVRQASTTFTLLLVAVALTFLDRANPTASAETNGGAANVVLLPSGYSRVTLPALRNGPRDHDAPASSFAHGINNSNEIVGSYDSAAVIWDSRGKTRRIEKSGLSTAISDCGAIVCVTDFDSGPSRAWLLRKNKKTWIGPIDESTTATSVNCFDEVVGARANPAASGSRAFYWSTRTGLLDLGLNDSAAHDVNDAGVVVGNYSGGGTVGSTAFVWDTVNGLVNLGTIIGCVPGGGLCSRVSDINNLGQVVGKYRIGPSAVDYPFVWSRVDGKVDIPVVNGQALAINDSGMVAGIRSEPGLLHTLWVWTPASGAFDVDTISDTNFAIVGLRINELGDIVGARTSITGEQSATLWRHPEAP